MTEPDADIAELAVAMNRGMVQSLPRSTRIAVLTLALAEEIADAPYPVETRHRIIGHCVRALTFQVEGIGPDIATASQ